MDSHLLWVHEIPPVQLPSAIWEQMNRYKSRIYDPGLVNLLSNLIQNYEKQTQSNLLIFPFIINLVSYLWSEEWE